MRNINLAAQSLKGEAAGRIGLVGDHVVKFETHWQERIHLPWSGVSSDQVNACNFLRGRIRELLSEVLNGQEDKALLDQLTSLIGAPNSAKLLDRSIVASVIDKVEERIAQKSQTAAHHATADELRQYSSEDKNTTFKAVMGEFLTNTRNDPDPYKDRDQFFVARPKDAAKDIILRNFHHEGVPLGERIGYCVSDLADRIRADEHFRFPKSEVLLILDRTADELDTTKKAVFAYACLGRLEGLLRNFSEKSSEDYSSAELQFAKDCAEVVKEMVTEVGLQESRQAKFENRSVEPFGKCKAAYEKARDVSWKFEDRIPDVEDDVVVRCLKEKNQGGKFVVFEGASPDAEEVLRNAFPEGGGYKAIRNSQNLNEKLKESSVEAALGEAIGGTKDGLAKMIEKARTAEQKGEPIPEDGKIPPQALKDVDRGFVLKINGQKVSAVQNNEAPDKKLFINGLIFQVVNNPQFIELKDKLGIPKRTDQEEIKSIDDLGGKELKLVQFLLQNLSQTVLGAVDCQLVPRLFASTSPQGRRSENSKRMGVIGVMENGSGIRLSQQTCDALEGLYIGKNTTLTCNSEKSYKIQAVEYEYTVERLKAILEHDWSQPGDCSYLKPDKCDIYALYQFSEAELED